MHTLKILILISLLSLVGYAQQPEIHRLLMPLEADEVWGVDAFQGVYYSKNNILYKNWNQQILQFGDYSLGELSNVYILNPLKILLFYKNTNTIIYIDKYFNEIERIDFNGLIDFKNVTQVAPANDNSIWIFDANTQRLELFDTTQRKTLLNTIPIQGTPISIQSNFNFCWLLTNEEVIEFNIYGSITNRFKNEGSTNFKSSKLGLVFQKEGQLFLQKNSQNLEKIDLPEISWKQFQVTNEILYIYDLINLYSLNLIPPKNE